MVQWLRTIAGEHEGFQVGVLVFVKPFDVRLFYRRFGVWWHVEDL